MKESLSRIIILTKRDFKEILRDPLSLIFTIGMPLLLEILFYFIFHGLTSQFEMRYLAPGIVVFAQSFISLFVGLLIAIDRSTSFLTRLYVSKARSYEFIFSYALSMIPIIFVQSLLFF
ncbi:MAG: ABC transporter permease, partial [Bacilli bacterium]|nr:ABC transporter permease [Bacilli bacterium]